MAFILPPTLEKGDTIGVMAPSSYIQRDEIEKSKAFIENLGYNVFIHPQTYERHNQSAGTELQKVLALQGLWQREDIKAIWAAGGGNRALHLLNSMNFETMAKHQKAFIGFSDTTALLNAITHKTKCITFHGPVFKQLHKHKDTHNALNMLQGQIKSLDLSNNNFNVVKEGEASGPIFGGCLSVFQTLVGTPYMPDLNGAILMLEDTGDHISRLDRMLNHLKLSGAMNNISGLIIGECLDLQDGARPYGFSWKECIESCVQEQNIPVVMNAPFSHGNNLKTTPIGKKGTLNTRAKTLSF